MADQHRPLTDAELEVALRDLGQWLAYPPTPPLATAVRRRLAAAPAPRPGLWAAWAPIARRLALALLALALLASLILALSPDARWVVADRLGLRGVTIEFVPTVPTATPAPTVTATPTPAPTPTAALTPIPTPTAAPTPIPTPVGARLGLGQPVPLAEARQRASFPVLVPSLPTLGEPDEVYVTGGAPAPTVALLYRARPGLPVAAETGASLLLVQFTADLEEGFLGKGVGPETQLERLTLNGAPAFWVTGQPHSVFYLDRQGRARQETIRLAGNVLLWQRGALTLRLEGAMSREEALRIADSLR